MSLPTPFIKWVGGKRQLVHKLIAHMPSKFGFYYEPFVGGGALFFAVRPDHAVLSDQNLRLVRTWRAIRGNVDGVIRRLKAYPHNKPFFLEMRKRDIDAESDDAEVAAWFIYLNKTGFNGLYRVNRSGWFNVPFGDFKNPTICNDQNLRACSAALHNVRILHDDFHGVLGRALEGDFVYFDPPYVPLSPTSDFTSYTSTKFGLEKHTHLRDVALGLRECGVHVLLSNSDTETVRELYKDFKIERVQATRRINSKADGRGCVSELIIH